MLDQCSARSPRSVLEMVGASSRRTPRLQFPKHSRDRNAVGKRWGARGSIFRFFGPSCRLARGASEECVSGTLFLQLGWEEMQPVGATKAPPGEAQAPPRHAIPDGRQVGGPAPRGLPSPGAACAGGAPNRPRPRAPAVRPARGNPWGRSGRRHAPEAARTGPVSALRRYSSWSPPGRWLNEHNGHFFGPAEPAPAFCIQGGHSGPLGVSNGSYVVFG